MCRRSFRWGGRRRGVFFFQSEIQEKQFIRGSIQKKVFHGPGPHDTRRFTGPVHGASDFWVLLASSSMIWSCIFLHTLLFVIEKD